MSVILRLPIGNQLLFYFKMLMLIEIFHLSVDLVTMGATNGFEVW